MEEKMAKFVSLVKELKALGEDIIEQHEDELYDGVFDELDVMTTHCGCCLNILEAEGIVCEQPVQNWFTIAGDLE